MKALHMVGAGGHARVVFDLVQGITPGRPVVWHDDSWQTLEAKGPIDDIVSVEQLWNTSDVLDCFVAIGNAATRLRLIEELISHDHSVCSLVHGRATLSPYAEYSLGSVVMAGAVVQTGAVLEEGVIVNTAASVDHDCRLYKAVHVAPGAHLAGNVTVREQTWIGAGAVVKEGLDIGANVMVGAGAVVVQDVPDGVIVLGNPGRIADHGNSQ